MTIKLSTVTGVSPDPEEAKSSSRIVDNSRKVGIEIEVENANIPQSKQTDPLLIFEVDGSLRNNGLEIKTIPVKGNQILLALEAFKKVIQTSKTKVDCSDRAGLHVHVDLRDATSAQLIRVLTTYLIVERCLYKYCGEERMYNPYCTPLFYNIHNTPDTVLAMLYSSSSSTILGGITHHNKYTGLNFRPLQTLGTIEFRMHKGSVDPEEILNWTNVVLSLVKYGMETTVSPQEIIDKVCLDADNLLLNVFNGTLGIPKEELYEDLLQGARTAQELLRARQDISNNIQDSLMSALYKDVEYPTEEGIALVLNRELPADMMRFLDRVLESRERQEELGLAGARVFTSDAVNV